MSSFKTGLKYWLQVFLVPIYWLSFLSPRDKKIWLLGSTFGRRFADNPKYVYLYLNQFQKDNVRAIWITHDKRVCDFLREHEMEVYYYRSLRGIYYCLRGGVYIFDNYSKDISFWLSGGALKVNLWHGTGTKKINHDNKFDLVRHPVNLWQRFRTALRRMSDEKPHHYTLATSSNMANLLSSAFQSTLDHMLVVGHPRNDILFPTGLKNILLESEREIGETLKALRSQGLKTIFYAPTFRDSETIFFDVMDLEKFNKFLKEHSLVFCTKLHVKSKLRTQFSELKYSNIIDIPADVDTYTVLSYADMLVIDYSSIYLDYMMLDRPVVAFPYDYDEYIKNSRECYFDYYEFIPEEVAMNMEELMNGIIKVFEQDECRAKRIERRTYHYDDIDGYSSERLYHAINNII
ncbi:MAG: putative glycosyl/glycerophosphate transferase involved in teichoic acid biosynthesis [Herbinix sp.]|jgi:CDP-glycerol glycerophosphotransferase (TagB/SpsB family)|nr:putative glycosyl/glycerophosphate transferase involved in teichoic acid biosynthesis [Herbinix sp.]